MLIELPLVGTVVADTVAWLAIHMGVAYLMTQRPASHFDHQSWLHRLRGWERHGRLYDELFAVAKWKRLLPDGAALFKRGFRKKRLQSRAPAYLERFRIETCRGESTHWVVLLCGPLFVLWNPPDLVPWMIGYGVVANLPCIVVQRYNRYRLNRILNAANNTVYRGAR